MTLSKTIWLKRLTASILLGVWILLHLVKGLHHHHAPTSSSSHDIVSISTIDAIDEANGSTTADCSICDFHLAKNADHLIAEYTIQHPSLIDTFFPDHHSSFVSAFTTHIKGRGPPCNA